MAFSPSIPVFRFPFVGNLPVLTNGWLQGVIDGRIVESNTIRKQPGILTHPDGGFPPVGDRFLFKNSKSTIFILQ